MASQLYLLAAFFFFFFNIASSDLVLEDGYEVTTVIDGHKLKINPHSVLLRPGSSDLIVLDSSRSLIYTVSFPLSNESVVKRLSGEGVAGHSDGEPDRARFNKPRSFAIDAKGNIYVADKNNHAIRKIDASGDVTTVAGGSSNKTGREDGPAQNATFSDDFELIVVPERCILLVADHGNQLVRQIALKAEDCKMDSHSHSGLRAVTIWSVALVFSCLLGIIIGVVVRPYIVPHQGSSRVNCSTTWKLCLMDLGKQSLMFCFDIRSAVVSSQQYALLKRLFWLSLSHLSLMFSRINYLEPLPSSHNVSVSLLEPDHDHLYEPDTKRSESDVVTDQLKDLISFEESPESPTTSSEEREGTQVRTDLLPDCQGKRLDNMILANIKGFAEVTEDKTVPAFAMSCGSGSGLVRRR